MLTNEELRSLYRLASGGLNSLREYTASYERGESDGYMPGEAEALIQTINNAHALLEKLNATIENPRATPVLTPCAQMGYRVGDRFEAVGISDRPFTKGSIVELVEDDETDIPLFRLVEGECTSTRYTDETNEAFVSLDNVKKIT
jgi:hypothetical protein